MSEGRYTFYVYVVELRPLPEHGPSVYVGSSALTPKTRYDHHRFSGQGDRRASSRHVRKRGVRLRPDLAPRATYSSRDDAKRAEQKLRTSLERRGFEVYGSCRPSRRCTL